MPKTFPKNIGSFFIAKLWSNVNKLTKQKRITLKTMVIIKISRDIKTVWLNRKTFTILPITYNSYRKIYYYRGFTTTVWIYSSTLHIVQFLKSSFITHTRHSSLQWISAIAKTLAKAKTIIRTTFNNFTHATTRQMPWKKHAVCFFLH